jgi:hypothetical protein
MTTTQRIETTPMAPYINLMRAMTREQKRIVVTFLTETMDEPTNKRQVPVSFKKLRGMLSITDEDIAQDDRLAHIMNR